MKIKSLIALAIVAMLSVGASFAQGKKALVVYFSRVDENYGVGTITEGNTAVIAKMIASKTGADLYEIKTVKAYPKNYKECTDVAKSEQRDNARPAIQAGSPSLSQYDTIFLGYPIWWGDLPMCVYTWLEANNLSGKKVIPFVTHEGSGLSGTPAKLKNKIKGSSVEQNALAIRGATAQNKRSEAQKSVDSWLKALGY